MAEKELRCPGCSSFSKKVSPGCMFKDVQAFSREDDTVKCGNCNKEFSAEFIASNKDGNDNLRCPDCGRVIKI